ncbi:DnaB-like helicase C-terminal domain-containing protein [Butyrivibrio sp. INlla16]|uniref:replicative DNA helicase n=1 Tax=Butyrivibrio sp. INlla16 TaxID=1520807 RepID=UPI00087FACC1|nr:DnaB-like helicase C-terminal domain-containing protein [Butyrivibrio sp. INlla16]SDB63740.1 DnaB-like helicase C terminal domain-containing protein [Butyrivibrio sp. INlla16]
MFIKKIFARICAGALSGTLVFCINPSDMGVQKTQVNVQAQHLDANGGSAVNVGTTSTVKKIKIVSEKSILRKLIHTCGNAINRCYSNPPEIKDVMDETQKEIFAITQSGSSEDFEPISMIVMNALNRIERASKLHGTVTGHATGFSQLDYKTAGFQPSDLIIIAARPSMGKTAFVLNIAQHMAIHDVRYDR